MPAVSPGRKTLAEMPRWTPAPAHGLLSLWGDGSHANTRGPKHPVGQTGRSSQPQPWVLGLRFVVWMAAWDGSRVPVGGRIILPKRHAA
jgi:hypothetical protein